MSCDFQAKIALLDFRPTTASTLRSKLLTLEPDVFFLQSVTTPPTDKNVGQIQIKYHVQLTKA